MRHSAVARRHGRGGRPRGNGDDGEGRHLSGGQAQSMESRYPTVKRRIALLGAVVLIFALALLLSTCRGRAHYLAHSRIRIEPFTNAVLAPAFHNKVLRSIPEARLEHVGSSSMIRMVVVAETAQESVRIDTNATERVCAEIKQTFGATAEVIDTAVTPYRPYSFLEDDLWPRIRRIWNRLTTVF